jgi:hypothetical protein
MVKRNPEIDALMHKAINYKGDDCLLWPFSRNPNGYAHLSSGRFHKHYKTTSASKMICIEVYGPPPTPAHEAAHNCGKGNLGCINRHHLRWTTHKDNFADDQLGEDHHSSKLTKEEIIEIRNLAGTMTHQDIAEKYNVSRSQVTKIINKYNWTWLEEQSDAELIFETTKPRMKDLFK